MPIFTNRKFAQLLFIVSLFSVAMGFLESAVVVYLREIYYPAGFNFPLAPIDHHIALTEILREAATLIMLLTLGILAGKNAASRFAWFIYSFAIWDIFYYVFLKLLLNWPESFMTDDILFLIPVTWVGPVITPVIVSLTMILQALIILYFEEKAIPSKITSREWLIFAIGSLVLITAFTWDYSAYILEHYSLKEIWSVPDKNAFYSTAGAYVPRQFNWFLFVLGEGVILAGIAAYYRRLCRKKI